MTCQSCNGNNTGDRVFQPPMRRQGSESDLFPHSGARGDVVISRLTGRSALVGDVSRINLPLHSAATNLNGYFGVGAATATSLKSGTIRVRRTSGDCFFEIKKFVVLDDRQSHGLGGCSPEDLRESRRIFDQARAFLEGGSDFLGPIGGYWTCPCISPTAPGLDCKIQIRIEVVYVTPVDPRLPNPGDSTEPLDVRTRKNPLRVSDGFANPNEGQRIIFYRGLKGWSRTAVVDTPFNQRSPNSVGWTNNGVFVPVSATDTAAPHLVTDPVWMMVHELLHALGLSSRDHSLTGDVFSESYSPGPIRLDPSTVCKLMKRHPTICPPRDCCPDLGPPWSPEWRNLNILGDSTPENTTPGGATPGSERSSVQRPSRAIPAEDSPVQDVHFHGADRKTWSPQGDVSSLGTEFRHR